MRGAAIGLALSDQMLAGTLAVVAWTMSNPFRYFNSSPEVIRLFVMMYVRYPPSLRNVEDLLAERGIDITHETVRFEWKQRRPIERIDVDLRKQPAFRHGFGKWEVRPFADIAAQPGMCGEREKAAVGGSDRGARNGHPVYALPSICLRRS